MATVKQRAEAADRLQRYGERFKDNVEPIEEAFADVEKLLEAARAVTTLSEDSMYLDYENLRKAIALFDEENANVRTPK